MTDDSNDKEIILGFKVPITPEDTPENVCSWWASELSGYTSGLFVVPDDSEQAKVISNLVYVNDKLEAAHREETERAEAAESRLKQANEELVTLTRQRDGWKRRFLSAEEECRARINQVAEDVGAAYERNGPQKEAYVMDKLIEQLADAEHASWSHWMDYLFSVSVENDDGSFTISAPRVKHWKLQALTRYQDLSEREKESDREEVRKIMPYIDAACKVSSTEERKDT